MCLRSQTCVYGVGSLGLGVGVGVTKSQGGGVGRWVDGWEPASENSHRIGLGGGGRVKAIGKRERGWRGCIMRN